MFQKLGNKLIKMSKTESICWMILIVSLILKMIYAMQVDCYYSPHDIGYVCSPGETHYGHIGYIQYLYEIRRIPDMYENEFYHPPLFHLVGAAIALMHHVTDKYTVALEFLQGFNMFVAWMATVFGYKVLKKAQVADKFLIFGTAAIAFSPAFYILGGELNNDCFAAFFTIAIIYYTYCWIEEQSLKNIMKISIAIILGMMSKTSAGIVAVSVGIVFLFYMLKNRVDIKKYLTQYLIFGAITIPCGLSFLIFHKITFDLPFNYVLPIRYDSPLYVGDNSLWTRLGLPPLSTMFSYEVGFENVMPYHSNIWRQIFMTMNFDEGLLFLDTGLENFAAILLLWTSIVLGILGVIVVIINLFAKEINIENKVLISGSCIILLISIVKFSFDYPQVCTMNFRYIVPVLVFIMAAFGERENKRPLPIALSNIVYIGITIQSVLATLLYLFCAVEPIV